MAVTTTTLAPLNPIEQLEIVKRLQKMAFFHATFQLFGQSYAKLKSTNGLVESTLDQAEKSLQLVAQNVAYPVIHQLEQPLHFADNLACQGFDKIQEQVSVLSKTSEELKDRSLKYMDDTTKIFQGVKKQTLDNINSVLSVSDNLVKSVDTTLKAVENSLQYLLPANVTESDEPVLESQVNGNVKRIISRMGQFSERVRRRLLSYTQQRLIPAVFDSVLVLKDSVLTRVNNSKQLLASTPLNTFATTQNGDVKTTPSKPSKSTKTSDQQQQS